MNILTYIINLPSSIKRKEYMEGLLGGWDYLDLHFIEAAYGKSMSDDEISEQFDCNAAKYRYGRELNRGEIGCTLSHRKCYQSLVDSEEDYCLIVEDDISIIRQPSELVLNKIEKKMRSEKPVILFISGDYWYFTRKDIVHAYDAVGSYAYFINKTAAKLILQHKPANTADDWFLYKKYGVKLYAVCPYWIDANLNMEQLSSDIEQTSWTITRNQLSYKDYVKALVRASFKKVLKGIGHFESKVRVINNKPVGEIPTE